MSNEWMRRFSTAQWDAIVRRLSVEPDGDLTNVNELTVGSFGAVGDGTTDDYAALQTAIDTARLAQKTLVFEPNKTYSVSQELKIYSATDSPILRIRGNGAIIQCRGGATTRLTFSGNGSTTEFEIPLPNKKKTDLTVSLVDTITGEVTTQTLGVNYTQTLSNTQAGVLFGKLTFNTAPPATKQVRVDWTGMRALMSAEQVTVRINDLQFDGNGLASFGFFSFYSSFSRFENLNIYSVIVDGFHSAGFNDSCTYLNCTVRFAARTYYAGNAYPTSTASIVKIATTGTVATTSGSAVITGTGTAFLNMGLRRGDMIFIGDGDPPSAGHGPVEWLQVGTVDSDTQITALYNSGYTRSGMGYLGQAGYGFFEASNGDNNINIHQGWLMQNIGGSGFMARGLYGNLFLNNQVDAVVGFAMVHGVVGESTYGTIIKKLYAEDNGGGGVWIVQGGVECTGLILGGGLVTLDWLSDVTAGGWWTDSTPSGVNGIQPIGENYSDIPVTKLQANAFAKGAIKGRSHTSATTAGNSSLTMADNSGNAWAAVSGVEDPAGGYDDNAKAFRMKVHNAVSQHTGSGGSGARVTTKYALEIANSTDGVIAGIQFDSAFILPGTNDTTGGNRTIHKPKGRFRIASGASAVTITNELVYSTSQVMLSKRQSDSAAKDYELAVSDGSFTVTLKDASNATVNAGANIDFDFFVLT